MTALARLLMRWCCFVLAMPLWLIGELGTLGAYRTADHPYTGYVALNVWFLLPWAASAALIWMGIRLTERKPKP